MITAAQLVQLKDLTARIESDSSAVNAAAGALAGAVAAAQSTELAVQVDLNTLAARLAEFVTHGESPTNDQAAQVAMYINQLAADQGSESNAMAAMSSASQAMTAAMSTLASDLGSLSSLVASIQQG